MLIVSSNLDAVSRIFFFLIWSLSPRRTHSQRLSIFPVRLFLHTTYRLSPENTADGRGLNSRLTTIYLLSFISRFAQKQVKIQWENCSPRGINHLTALARSSIRILNSTQEFPGKFTAGIMKNIQAEKRKKDDKPSSQLRLVITRHI